MKQMIWLALMFTLIVASFTAPLDDQEDDTVMDGPYTEGSGSDMIVEPPQDANTMDGPQIDNNMDGTAKEGSLGDNDMDGPIYDNNINETYEYQDWEGGCGDENGTIVKVKPEQVCQGRAADVAFLLDFSTSVGLEKWKQQVNLTMELIKLFDIPKVRVTVISYATTAIQEVMLHWFDTTSEYIDHLKGIKFAPRSRGQYTHIYTAIKKVDDLEFRRNNIRPNTPRFVVAIVDGQPHDNLERLQEAKDRLMAAQNGVKEIFAIDIGTYTPMAYLKAIASHDDNIIKASDNGGLVQTRDTLAYMICGDVFMTEES